MPDKPVGSRAPSWAGQAVTTDISTRAMQGRDDVLALCERRLAEVQAGHRPPPPVPAGEAGTGKSRVRRALQDRAEQQGFVRWGAEAFPQDVELSAGLLLDLGHA